LAYAFHTGAAGVAVGDHLAGGTFDTVPGVPIAASCSGAFEVLLAWFLALTLSADPGTEAIHVVRALISFVTAVAHRVANLISETRLPEATGLTPPIDAGPTRVTVRGEDAHWTFYAASGFSVTGASPGTFDVHRAGGRTEVSLAEPLSHAVQVGLASWGLYAPA